MYVNYVGETEQGHIWHPKGNYTSNPSGLHLKARALLKAIFPTITILEEVAIEPIKFKTLYLDFYIPVLQYAIEVHGEQHYKFVPHYHRTRYKFFAARKNDRLKEEWCFNNKLSYISLPFNQQSQWEQLING